MGSHKHTRELVTTIWELQRRYNAPVHALPIAHRVYLDASNVRRHLKKLERAGYIERVGKRGGWRVPAVIPALPPAPEAMCPVTGRHDIHQLALPGFAA